jgi:hypothetical protein
MLIEKQNFSFEININTIELKKKKVYMKRFNLFLLLISFFMTGALTAQTTMEEGYIKFEVTDVQAEDEQMAAQLSMMKGTTNEVYFTKGKSLSKMNMMGGMMKMTVLANSEDNTGTMLFDAMGQKYKIPMTSEEKEAMKAKNEGQMGDLEFVYDKEDKKTIVGYECYKMTIKSENMEGMEMSAYITEDIVAGAEVLQGVDASKMAGFPLEYIINQGQFSMVFSALEISDELDASVFELNTKGFKEMTMEEFQNAMGQMGGMGF